jgi:sulfatase maturation enzyme AslB (radical SAM superfamily)
MLEDKLFQLIEIAVGERPIQPGEILAALEDENRLVKLSALDVLSGRYACDLTGGVLKLLFHPDDAVGSKALETIKIDPFFAFEKRDEAEFASLDHDAPGRGIYLEELFSHSRKRELSGIVKAIDDKDFHRALARFALLPGVENLDLEEIFAGGKQLFLAEFQEHRRGYFQAKYPPQVAAAPSYRCNLDCSYCYASDLIRTYPEDMSPGQIEKMLDILDGDAHIKRVGIIGGEPGIFPGLKGFIQALEKRGLGCYFATNGIVEPGVFEEITGRRNLVSVTVHVEKDNFYSHDKIEKLSANIKTLGQRNIETIIRYNLVEPGNRDWDFLLKYIDMPPGFKFSFAVVFPSQSGNVRYVELEKLKDFSAKIIALLEFLKKRMGDNFKVAFAKPFPPCAFSAGELAFVLKHVEYKNVCEIDRNHYTNNTCINPDLSYFPCMALTREKYKGKRLPPWEEMKIQNKSLCGFLLTRPLMEECRGCRLFYLGVCQAACYAYID